MDNFNVYVIPINNNCDAFIFLIHLLLFWELNLL